MRRTIHIFSFCITAVIILAVAVVFTLPLYLPKLLANTLSKTMGVPVEVRGVDLGFKQSSFSDIWVHNPPGSEMPYALKIKTITIRAPFREVLEPEINIQQILFQDIALGVEFYSADRKKSNWDTILATVNKPLHDDTTDSPGSKREISIEELRLDQIYVYLKLYDKPVRALPPLKKIVITHIDPENGQFAQRITRILTNHIVRSVSGAAGIVGITGVVIKAPVTVIQNVIVKPFQFLFGGGKKNEQEQKCAPKSN